VTAGPSQIWLVRHGETEWSATGRHTSRTDVALTETGREQARALGRMLGGHEFARVLSSPLSRALETCRLAGLGDDVEIDDELREWDYGNDEGRTTAEIRRERPGWTVWAGSPGGEPLDAVGARARRVLERAAAAGGDAALFSHGHCLRILGSCWLGLAPEGGRFFVLGTAAISVLGYERETRVFRHWNRVHEVG
jgi:broad specificity phosphatase PhoE